jgi:DnaK suppressor protein
MPSAKRPVRKSSSSVKTRLAAAAKARAGRAPPSKAARKTATLRRAPVKKAATKAKTATGKPVVSKPAATARPKAPKGGKPAVLKAPAAGPKAKASPAKIQAPALREMVVRSTPGLARANGRKALTPSKNAARRGPDRYDPDALIHGIKPYQPRPGEAYMNPAQLDHFRAILKAWRRELMEEVDRTVHHMQDEASNFPDPNDRATQESEFGLELRTRDRERKLLKKIDAALERIGDRAYGYCEETGEEIGLKRLEARPVATLSLEAQERREMAEKQYGERDDHYR